MEQNTEAWHAWRAKGIGASESPIIMGISPYLTPLQLWQQKLGVKKFDQSNPATQLGQYFEKEALDIFNKEMKSECFPALKEHPEFNFIRASLDGEDSPSRIAVEIKYVGKRKFEEVTKLKPIEHHYPQLQHQMLVTGYQKMHYMSYILNEDKSKIQDFHILTILRDDEYINKQLFPRLKEFWEYVKTQTQPPLSKRDEIEIDDDLSVMMVKRLVTLQKQQKDIDLEVDKIKASLKSLTDRHPRILCDDMVIYVQHRKGSVDYDSIPQLKGVDFDSYRKPPVEFVSFRSRKK